MNEKEYIPWSSDAEISEIIATLNADGWCWAGCGTDYQPGSDAWAHSLSRGVGSKFKNGLSIVDLGCGYGRFLNYMYRNNINEFKYYGIELRSPNNGDPLVKFNKKMYEPFNSPSREIIFGFEDDEDFVNNAIERCDTLLLGSVFTHLRIEESVKIIKRFEKLINKERGSVVFSVIKSDVYSLEVEGAYGHPHTYGVAYITQAELELLTLNGKYQLKELGEFPASTGHTHTICELTS